MAAKRIKIVELNYPIIIFFFLIILITERESPHLRFRGPFFPQKGAQNTAFQLCTWNINEIGGVKLVFEIWRLHKLI